MSNDSTALVRRNDSVGALAINRLSQEQVDLIKRTIARGATNDELALFIATADRLGLDPFAKQIYSIQRWNPQTREKEMVTMVGIDGLRAGAEKTGEYLPGPRPVFTVDERTGMVVSCVATVMKFRMSQWHAVEAEVFFEEYAQKVFDKNANEFRLTKNWEEKPRVMLGKCAEAQALRRAFPTLAGAYDRAEFNDEDVIDVTQEPQKVTAPPPPVTAPPSPRVPGPSPMGQRMLEEEAKRQGGKNTSRPEDADAPKPPRKEERRHTVVVQENPDPPAAPATAPTLPETSTFADLEEDPVEAANKLEGELGLEMLSTSTMPELNAVVSRATKMKKEGKLLPVNVDHLRLIIEKHTKDIAAGTLPPMPEQEQVS